jgi:hypothetical protein
VVELDQPALGELPASGQDGGLDAVQGHHALGEPVRHQLVVVD